MNIVKRAVKIFGMAAMVMLISAVSVLAETTSDIEKPLRLYNEGFEVPAIKGTYQQVAASTVPYWRTTAITSNTSYNQIELFVKNTNTYISGTTLIPRAGLQAAELNPEEPSTMYQYVYGAPGSVYEWGISHRARSNKRTDTTTGKTYRDIMAVFIGPKQPYNPTKTGGAATGTDQFTKTVDWLKSNGHLDTSGLIDGDCKAFEVFTTKFDSNGGFEPPVNYTDPISLTQTEEHTEKWHVWIITSSKESWYDYGVTAAEDCDLYKDGQTEYAAKTVTNPSYPDDTIQIKYKQPDYNYQYTVPASDNSGEAVTMYALCAYETASDHSTKDMTIGNFIDDVKLSLKVPVRVTSTEGGSTAVEIPGNTGTVTNTQQFSGTTDAGEKIKLTITPGERGDGEAGNYKLLGVFVNNKWTPVTDERFKEIADGTYTYEQDAEDGENYIHIVFAKNPYIIHSPNGGTYKGTTADTADKIEGAETSKTYTFSEAPKAGNQALFAHWIIAGVTNTDGTPVTVGADHTVEAVVNSENSSLYDITVKDGDTVVATITKTDVVVFVAHYEYPQTVNIYTMIGGKWELSEKGGTASISGINISESPSNELSNATKTIYVEDNTIVSVSASPNEGYRLVRMVSDDGTVTTEKTYTYNADGPRTISVYYMAGKRKPIVSYVDEKNTGESPSYVWDTNLGTIDDNKILVSDVGGIYGNTVSTAFTAFWSGDENTYTYVQWVIDLPFDTATLLKSNPINGNFTNVINFDPEAVKTDTNDVNENFRGAIYRCTSENTAKQLTVNFPTVITGASSIYSTIILDGIYSPTSTALLHSVTEINAKDGNVLTPENGFSIRTDKDTYRADNDNYYITTLN